MRKLKNYFRIEAHFQKDSHKIFLLPLFEVIFGILNRLSLLTILSKIFKPLECSYLATEIYVTLWFLLLIPSTWLVFKADMLPLWLLVFLCWRLSDIAQSWFNIFVAGQPKPLSAPRSLLLAFINYMEITVIFALIAYGSKSHFYPEIPSIIPALRYSIGVITTTSSRYDPATFVAGSIYYFEIAFGLAFLVVVISRVLSLFRNTTS